MKAKAAASSAFGLSPLTAHRGHYAPQSSTTDPQPLDGFDRARVRSHPIRDLSESAVEDLERLIGTNALPPDTRKPHEAAVLDNQAMVTFALIPGAGINPQVFAATIGALRDLGHEGVAPPLPLDDDAAHPSDHAAAVADAVEGISELVVVAQSLGAFSGPLAAHLIGADRIVLLAPMIPRPGETAGEWWENTGHQEAIGGLTKRYGAMREWGEEAMLEVFMHDVDPEVARTSAGLEQPPGAGMFTEPWPLDVWPEIPTAVLAPTEDRLFPFDFQRRVAEERLGLPVQQMGGGHLPMLSRPRELAVRLVELSTREGG